MPPKRATRGRRDHLQSSSQREEEQEVGNQGKRKPESDRSLEHATKKSSKKRSVQQSALDGPGNSKDAVCRSKLIHHDNTHNSIVHYLYRSTLGGSVRAKYLQTPFLRALASYILYRTNSPFDRRVTTLEWHPTHPNTVAVGSKGGDIILWDYEELNNTLIPGIGAGGCITGMKFDPFNSNQLYTSSVAGSTVLQDFTGRTIQTFTNTEDWAMWYCSLDVSADRECVITGDNVGHVVFWRPLGTDLEFKATQEESDTREFNPRCDWLLASASVDQTVKLWDLRYIKDKSSCLHTTTHTRGVNSGKHWPVATWHPRYDLIVAGRYPDPLFPGYTSDELRTVDVFDGLSGNMVCQLYDPYASGIVSLNKFNPMEISWPQAWVSPIEKICFNILIWSREILLMMKQEEMMKALRGKGHSVERRDLPSSRSPNLSSNSEGPESHHSALENSKTRTGTKESTKTQRRKHKDPGK
ncbi:hypothetical protein GDO86_019826 [Hymenochirus boettgeri]|uniref:DNA damage-binding protein 2 n=1 Tax=Hymenochirus boettgeri TaxID=247094 RepID=A0A8T2IJ43_9PIPI|nr:hypothetical protein GDO86_019826 [Hymenochirus boettgeri]